MRFMAKEALRQVREMVEKRKYVFQPEALRKYSETAIYYKNIRPRLGRLFVNEVESSILKIQSPSKLSGTVRRTNDFANRLTRKPGSPHIRLRRFKKFDNT